MTAASEQAQLKCRPRSDLDPVVTHWLQLAVYSAADRLQPHRYKADESYQVGQVGATPVACYLDGDGIVALAKAQGVDVIHPGRHQCCRMRFAASMLWMPCSRILLTCAVHRHLQ